MQIIATVAGSVCTNSILRSVIAPARPAIATQARKNKATFAFHIGSSIKKDQIKPAAKNKL
jgi:hypothetical protein